MRRHSLAILFLLLLPKLSLADDAEQTSFYVAKTYGSDALYNPVSAFFSYSLDTLQLTGNFDLENYDEDLALVWDHLRHPRRAINNEGGFRRFFNREIFPIDADYRRDSFAALPNYSLHLLGDGMTYRRDVEWFRSHHYPYPRLSAAVIAMVSEVLQEGLEAQNTTDADAIADVYIFRPLGILLFSNERFARAVRRTLDPVIWPTLTAWDINQHRFANTGIAYVYRPPRFRWQDKHLFVYTGLNNMLGLSHQRPSGDTLSWGFGASVQEIVRQRNIQADLRPSAGIFRSRNGSLLWSVLINDTGDQRFRLNLYPKAVQWLKQTGLYFSVNDAGDVAAGFVYRLPIALGISAR